VCLVTRLLEQAALHVGPLSVSQPALVIIDPFASIALSVWLFDERFTDSPARIAIAVLFFCGHGSRGHRAVPDSTARPHPVETGHVVIAAENLHSRT
jgi:hypothetical protein